MWREGRLFIASASATVSRGKPQVVVANKILPGDIDSPSPSLAHGNQNLEPTPGPEPNLVPAPASLPVAIAVSDNGKIMELVIGSLSLIIVGVGIHYSCVLPTTKSASEIWQEFIHRFGYREDFKDFPNLAPATTSDTTTTTTATTTVIMTQILRSTDGTYRNSNGGGNHLLPALYALGFGSLGAIISTLLFIPANRTRVVAWFMSTTATFEAFLRPVVMGVPAHAEARNIQTNAAVATVAGRNNATSEGQVKNTADEPPVAGTTDRPPVAAEPAVVGSADAVEPLVTAGVPVVADGSTGSADGSTGSEEGPESWVAMGRGGAETG